MSILSWTPPPTAPFTTWTIASWTAEDDAFGNAIAVAVALSSASIGAENVLPRFVVDDEAIQSARDDFAIAEARTVFPASFAMPMERT